MKVFFSSILTKINTFDLHAFAQPIGVPVKSAYESVHDAVALHCQGIDIIVNSLRRQIFNTKVFTKFGIDVILYNG